jgi:uncharacterized protein (DUF433 family)
MITKIRKIRMNKPAVFNVYKYISSDPQVMHGKPCIKGTRIPVSLVVAMLSDGMSVNAILKEYPSLTKTSIRAALKYASLTCEFNTDKI